MFGSIEWEIIRAAMRKHAGTARAWTEWVHQKPAEVVLPCGETVTADRGAEQGDAFGPLQASLAAGERMV